MFASILGSGPGKSFILGRENTPRLTVPGSEGHLKPHSRQSWDSWSGRWDELINDWKNPHSIYYASCTLHIADFMPQMGMVLSLGCGTAECALRLRKEHVTIVCTDFSRGMLDKAVENHRAGVGQSVVFVLCDACRLPFRDSTFALVYARGALLSYVPAPSEVLAESRRVLVLGGVAAFDAMNWDYEARGGKGYGPLSRDKEGRIRLISWSNQDKKQVKETIYLDPSGSLASLLGDDQSIRLAYPAAQPPGELPNGTEGDLLKLGLMKTAPRGRADVPVYLDTSESRLEEAVTAETMGREGQIACSSRTRT